MRRVPIGVGPSLFAGKHRRRIRESFGCRYSFERRKPVFIIMRAIVGLAPIGSRFQFFGERCGPLFPSEMTQHGELDGKRERLRLPRFSKDRSTLVAGKLRQHSESLG